MTLKLLIIGAVLLLSVAGCTQRSNSRDANYFASGNAFHEDRDVGDRDYRGDHEEHRTR